MLTFSTQDCFKISEAFLTVGHVLQNHVIKEDKNTSLIRKGVFKRLFLQLEHTKHSVWKHLSPTIASDDSTFVRQCWHTLDIAGHFSR